MGQKKILAQPDKPLDGMWSTLINTASKKCMTEYIRMSKTCRESIIPQIVQTNIHEYENSLRNNVRNMRVLYKGGLMSKKKYTSIRSSSDVAKETKKKSKNNQTKFMKKC